MKEESKAESGHLLSDYEKQEEFDDNEQTITLTLLFSVLVTVLSSLSIGFAMGYSSPVESELMKELDLSTSDYSLFGSITSIGGAVGAIVCGKLIDYLGRRRALGLADVFFVLGWFFIAICKDVWLLDLGRGMIGFAMTICGFAVPIYIAEFTPRDRRGAFVMLHTLIFTAGISLVFLLGLIVHWRTLSLIGIIPSLVQMISLFFIPESPRWLMMIGEDQKFVAALHRFRGQRVDISQEVSDIMEHAEVLKEKQRVNLLHLFQKKYAYTLTVGIGLLSLSKLVGGNAMLAYSRSLFEAAGFSGIVGTITQAIIQFPCVLFGILLTDKYGRRPLLMISAGGLCLGCSLTALAFILQDHNLLEGVSPYVALTGILVYIAAYAVGVAPVPHLIVSEIYPLNIKGVAGNVTILTSSFSGWLVAYAFNFSMEWSSSGTFFVLAGVSLVTLIFVAKLVPETKGKSLEEIHLLMSNVWQ